MARLQASQTLIALCTVSLLQGCVQSTPDRSDGPGGAEVTRAQSTKLVEQEVEAPEIFQQADNGLWDGRPSLGGVWVAYSGVTDPERVIIRNEANGQFVIGALFRRESDNPGPKFQVSSDAAEALGMLAGAPAKISVTALKREDAAPEPDPVDAIAATEPAPIDAPDAVASADPVVAGAAAALDGAAMPEGAAIAEAVPAEAPKPKKKFLGGIFSKKTPAEPEAPAPDATVALAAAGAIDSAPLPEPGAAPAPAADPVALAAVEPLPEAAAEPKPKKKFLGGLFARKADEPLDAIGIPPDPVPVSAPIAPAAPPVAAPAAEKLAKGYVQIGIFSVEDNANTAARTLSGDGMVPAVKAARANGKDYWRVVVGPATSKAERDSLLKKIRKLGFTDAYLVSG